MNELINTYKSLPTPFYAYNLDLLRKTIQLAKKHAGKHNFHIHYAVKANANPVIVEQFRKAGFGADCVSGNEVRFALDNGFSAEQIAFAGVGKTDEEIKLGLKHNIFSFNCESIPEIKIIDSLAKEMGKTARIALRINPNINAKTHHYITTGLEENKFGISTWEFEDLLTTLQQCSNIDIVGLHFHIGSQIVDLSVFKNLCVKVNQVQQWFAENKVFFNHINVGGGLGINYDQPEEDSFPDFENYFQTFADFLNLQSHQSLHFELGRALVAQCGQLITTTVFVKDGIQTNFVIVDAGMTELIRPALYQASHKIVNLTSKSSNHKVYDVVGPVCESSDTFAKRISLPETQRGDIIAILSTGAYGEVMANHYNLREKAKSYFFSENGKQIKNR